MSKNFIIILERWIVIPLIGYLITINWFKPEDKDWLIPLVDNVFGSAFIIIAYILTHKTQLSENGKGESLWLKCKELFFRKPEPPVTTTTTTTTERVK